jgi:hypothetical protein
VHKQERGGFLDVLVTLFGNLVILDMALDEDQMYHLPQYN